MFIVLEGSVRILRNSLPLGVLRTLDIFGELGNMLESRPGYPLARLRSAYAISPNTYLAVLSFENLLLLREESPAINFAVTKHAELAARKHPSLHPTVAELTSHNDDDLLPPRTLAVRAVVDHKSQSEELEARALTVCNQLEMRHDFLFERASSLEKSEYKLQERLRALLAAL